MNIDDCIKINPDDYLSKGRQLELVGLASAGYCMAAVRQCIREAAFAAGNRTIIPPVHTDL